MKRMNRRRFVAVTSVTATSVLLVACGNEPLSDEELSPTQIPDVAGAPPTIAPKTATPGAEAPATAEDAAASGDGVAAPAGAITIEAHDNFSFSPNEVDVSPGQAITVVNKGFLEHDLLVDEWGIGTDRLLNEDTGDVVIPDDAEIGSSVEFYCSVPGHRESGMFGQFTVVEASAAAPAAEATAAEDAPVDEGAAAPAEAITIEAHDDFSFDPNDVDVSPGQTVTVVNKGFMQHDLVVDDWGIGTELLNSEGTEDIVIPNDAEVGSSVEFHCTVPGHKESGMFGTFNVVEGVAAAPAEESAAEATADEEATAAEDAPVDEGAAAPAEAITIEAHDDFSFDPNDVDVSPGQTVTVVNKGFLEHDLIVDDWGVGTDRLLNEDTGDIVVPDDAEVGSSVEFYCSVPGHRESGMFGQFTVVEGVAAAPAEEPVAEATADEEATAAEDAPADEGAAAPAEAITIEAHDDFSFDPNEVDVSPGQTITLVNKGVAQHDLRVDDWDIGTELLNNEQTAELVIPEDAEVGSSVEFHCTVPGHKELGMIGTFNVVEGREGSDKPAELAPAAEATAASSTDAATPADEPAAEATAAEDAPAAEGTPQAVTVVGTQWEFQPAEFEIAPGGVITFQNETDMSMGLSSEEWDENALTPMIKSVSSGSSGEFTVPEDAKVGDEIEFTSNLTEAEKQGMVGTITIVVGDGSATPAAGTPEAATPVAGTPEAATPETGGSSAGSGDVIEVKMLDSFAFDPNEIEASVGDTLHFINEGFMQHDAAVDAWSDEPLTPYLNPGETADVVIPDIANEGEEYEFYCTVPGHAAAGMKGTITIV